MKRKLYMHAVTGIVSKVNEARLGNGIIVDLEDGTKAGAGCGRADQSLIVGDRARVIFDFGRVDSIRKIN